jgi:putative RNA 2'-phosphotransferase
MTEHDVALSKVLSHALRHEPWRYELELDDDGWADINQVLEAMREERPQWADLERADLEAVIATSAKKRHEIDGDRIRASYGHSVPGRLARTPAIPPEVLFHGTTRRALPAIAERGLIPMSRQYVHLSPTEQVAREVGRRRDRSPVLLRVDAGRAHADGVPFYIGNDVVWLADSVPAHFLDSVHP